MNQFVDLSMEHAVHHRFHTFTQLRVIFDHAKNSNENDDASSAGDACHMRITADRSGVSATAIEYRDHSGLDRVVRQLEAIAHRKLLKNIVEMSFDGALGYREPLGNFGVP